MAGDGAQAVRRALAILDCFHDGGPALGASDLGRRLDLPISTAHRLARTLVTAGFLEQDPATARFRLGPSIVELGRLSFHQRGLHRVVPELSRLARVTSAAVDLALRRGDETLILAGDSVRRASGTGPRRPMRSTALGKVLLAWSRDAAGLDVVRAQGYAVHDGEPGPGVRTLAVPVLDRAGNARYALALRAAPESITDRGLDWYLAQARTCARALEILLLPPNERRNEERRC